MAVYSRNFPKTDKPQPVLFLDRDGVLIVDRHYLADPQDVVLIPGVCQALQKAKSAGFILVGVSNQSGIGRGFFSEEMFQRVMVKMEEMLAAGGVALNGFYYCPHKPADNCSCRKPLPGLLDEATADLNWDARSSWVIGDKLSDVRLARDHGLSSVLVETGHGVEEKSKVIKIYRGDSQVGFAADLNGAISFILARKSGEVD